MPRLKLPLAFLVLLLPFSAFAVSLEQAVSGFQNCNFKALFYAPWGKQPGHPYFSERKLTPYKEENGLYFFKVKDTLFGLPVVEIVVPGTWDYHGIVFDVPLKKARATFKQRFGSHFVPSKKSKSGETPVLDVVAGNAQQSVFFCNEREGGL